MTPFRKFTKNLRHHWGVAAAWTGIRVTNRAVENMNNKVKAISHWAVGYRTPGT